MTDKIDHVAKAEELLAFLTGDIPDGYRIADGKTPNLTAKQAWTVISYLGDQHWQVPDFIERCGVCGTIYNTEREGACLDYGEPPYHFCDECGMHSREFREKKESEPQDSGGDDGHP